MRLQRFFLFTQLENCMALFGFLFLFIVTILSIIITLCKYTEYFNAYPVNLASVEQRPSPTI